MGVSCGWAYNSWREDRSGEKGTSVINYIGEMLGTTVSHMLIFPGCNLEGKQRMCWLNISSGSRSPQWLILCVPLFPGLGCLPLCASYDILFFQGTKYITGN